MDFIGRQGGRGLVKHENVRVDRESARYGDQRFLGARQVAHTHGRIERASDLRQSGGSRRLGGPPVDEAGFARIADHQGDVLGDRHPVDQTEILMDEGDGLPLTEPGRMMAIGRAAISDQALVGFVDAGERHYQCRFARAVFTQQGDNLAGAQSQRDAFESGDAAETLDDSVELDECVLRFLALDQLRDSLKLRRLAPRLSSGQLKLCYR